MQLTYKQYYNKVMGAWLGKSAGGIIGFKQENNKSLLDYTFETVFPDILPPNDDFDLQVMYLYQVLEKVGINFTTYELGKAFAKYNKCWANEYRVAIGNINAGINPPLSGAFNNEYFAASMGCPIRSELWALIAPGNPSLAMRFAEADGQIDHTSESIEGERFLAGIEAEAFFESDIMTLINNGLKRISSSCRLTGCVKKAIELHGDMLDWKKARNELVKIYGSCDASYSVINLGFVILALLFGGGDFSQTMLIAVNCGYDTDCTAATAGAILGLIMGADNIPPEWKEKIGSIFYAGTVDVDESRNTYDIVADITVNVGLSIVRDGLTSVSITELPSGYKNPIPAYMGKASVVFSYQNNLPYITSEKSHVVTIQLKNETDKPKLIGLSINPAAQLTAKISSSTLTLPPQSVVNISAEFSVRSGLLESRNISELTITEDGQASRYSIGLISPASYQVFGPYFDNYDTTKYSQDIYNGLQQKDEHGNVDLFPMFNGYVNVNREYIEGDKPSGTPDKLMVSAGNLLDLESQVSYMGPCCVYLTREFESDIDQTVHLLVGNNDAYKIWLNDELVGSDDRALYWYFQNSTIALNIKKGKNQLVYKLIRRNAPFKFSAMLSRLTFGDGVHVDIKNKI